MKNKHLARFLAGSILAGFPALQADEFLLDAPITNVMVYQNGGAMITRTATITIPAGQHDLVLKNLPDSLIDTDVPPSAHVTGGKSSLKGVRYDSQPEAAAASDLQKKIQDEIDAVNSKIADAHSRISVIQMQLDFLRSMGDTRDHKSSGTAMNFADIQKAMEFVGETASKLMQKIQVDQRGITLLEQERAALEREMTRSGTKRQDNTQGIFTVVSPATQDLQFSFNYFVNDAGWMMNVAASLDSEDQKLTLETTADIEQTTGESWDSVNLSLTNTQFNTYIGGINLNSEFLNLTETPQAMRYAAQDMAKATRAPMAEAITVTGGRSVETGYNRLYEITGSTTIPADSSSHKVLVSSITAPAKIVTRAVPKNNATAYVFADITLKDFESLRNVNATLMRDGQYVGTGTWPNLESNTALELPFGRDENVAIEYIEQAPADGDTGFINKRNVEEKHYIIKVTNHNTRATTVEIFDQYPVSGHEDIKVTPLKGATEPNVKNNKDQPGVISWHKTLKPGEEWTIKHEYRVEYPSDKYLTKRWQ
ncbi:mucoidy inhibitor MuiA family protein [Kordiimonas pumila]|uniref:Mucoidy inhibitor MuiA family protein n=1 Tax=Kordiimonas pumila TaxID=2161677 RepID=A0ABV7D2H3_9PROT|nr:mucoidy inhibitor MuiA family protein [Kordiimonas pumila]